MENKETRLFIDVKALATNFAQLEYFKKKFLQGDPKEEDDNFDRNFITDKDCERIFWNLVYNNHPDEVNFVFEDDVTSNTFRYFASEEGENKLKSILARIPFPIKINIITKNEFENTLEDCQYDLSEVYIIYSMNTLNELDSFYLTLEKYIKNSRVCMISEDIGIISRYNCLRQNNIFNIENFKSWV